MDRIEASVVEVLRKLDIFAKESDLQKLESRIDTLEKLQPYYVRRAAFWGFQAFIVVQFLVIIGLGLGLVYEILRAR